jgi:hypothetical protein
MRMRTRMRTAMAVAAVAAVGAIAPGVASADTWTSNGTPFAGPAHVAGTMTMRLPLSINVTCSVVLKGNLDNAGGVAQGQLQDSLFGFAAGGGSCITSLPNCSVSITVYSPATRPITTSGANVSFTNLYYVVSWSGWSGCSANGSQLNVSGPWTGAMTSNTNQIVFNNSPISTNAGPATLVGTLSAYAQNAAGNRDMTRPIKLQP